MSEPSAPLQIAVVGCGQIGSTFASRLARAGHEVTVVARPGSARLEQLRRDGAIVEVGGERAPVRVAERLDGAAAYDLVIVTLLAHKAAEMAGALRDSRAACILCMFNTFEPERLQEAIGSGRCAFGMPFVQAKLEQDGRLKATVGAAGQKTLLGDARWVQLFEAAGLPAALEPDMPLWLRCHAPMCVAFESVSTAGVRRGGGASWREAFGLAQGVKASFRLLKALGHPIYPQAKRRIDRSPTPLLAAMLWSMSRVRPFRELLATGKAECVQLAGVMAAAAARAGEPDLVAPIEAMKPS